MNTIIMLLMVAVGLCLVLISVAMPWLAVDWWVDFAKAPTSTSRFIELQNAIGITIISIIILFVDFKICLWLFKCRKDV